MGRRAVGAGSGRAGRSRPKSVPERKDREASPSLDLAEDLPGHRQLLPFDPSGGAGSLRRVVEVEPDQPDRSGPQRLREKHGPVPIGEPSEVDQGPPGSGGTASQQRSGEPVEPPAKDREVVPVGVDEDETAETVRPHLIG